MWSLFDHSYDERELIQLIVMEKLMTGSTKNNGVHYSESGGEGERGVRGRVTVREGR